MKTIEERANAYIGHPFEVDEDVSITMARDSYFRGATEQKAIDDIDLKETQRQRDECYDELVKLRTEKIEWKEKACEWLKSKADECFVSGDSVGEHLIFKDLSLAEFLKAMEK